MAGSKQLTLDVGDRGDGSSKQWDFVHDDETPFLLWRGGRGCGKTLSGWLRMLRRLWDHPGMKGLVLAPDYPRLESGILPTILDHINPAHIRDYKASPPQSLVLDNGEPASTIDFFTASNPEITRSLQVNDIWVDEYAYCPYQSWRVALGAHRHPPAKGMVNTMWATGTPLGYDWSYTVFGEDGKKGYKVFVTSIYENRKHLPKGYIEHMEEEYKGTDFEEQELLGKYTLFEGLVYPQFDDGNMWLAPSAPEFSLGVGGIDLGDVSPSVLVPMGIDKGQLWVPEEFYQRRCEYSDLFVAMDQLQSKYNIATWFCETTAVDFIVGARETGFDVRPCPIKDVQQGVRIVQQYFRDNLIHINTEKSPNGMRELRTYQHKAQNLGESFADTLVPTNDHYPDAVRYGVVGYEESGVATRRVRPSRGGEMFDWAEPVKLGRAGRRQREAQAVGVW